MGCTETKSERTEDWQEASPGEKFLDKYELHEVLGQGAFGIVHRARLKGSSEDYAVKMVDCVETSRADIDREIAMMRKLVGPCIVKIYDTFPEKVFVCLVLELHKGGDMIAGMCNYWKKKGMIPIPAMRSLSKQMWEAVAFVHSKGCVHRDIKGDNFLMDKPDVSDLSNRIYLSDFGTVCDIAPGQRLSGKCGTSNYWSPEFFDKCYGHKVDNWATGVVMYGLTSGKFPFKNENDTRTKIVSVPKRCPPEGVDLIKRVLDRKEERRWEAAQALQHHFFDSLVASSPSHTEEDNTEFKPEVRERGANGGVQLRRAELVRRLRSAASAPKRERRRSRLHGGMLRIVEKRDDGFVVEDDALQRKMAYQWWSSSKAQDLCKGFASAEQMRDTDIKSGELSNEAIAKLFKDHNVSLDGFGKGKARTFEEFAAEIRSGKLRLQLDASRHKHIVCVVDLVCVRLSVKDPSGKKYLVKFADPDPAVRYRGTGYELPTLEKIPHESTVQTARRFLQRLQLENLSTTFDCVHVESTEEIQQSQLYPGVQMVFLKEIVTGEASGAVSSGIMEDSSPNARSGAARFTWLTSDQVKDPAITGNSAQGSSDFSTLVYPPIGLEEEELLEYLQTNQIDTEHWGTGTARSVHEFAEELVKGEATLQKLQNGQVKRVVDVVVVKLSRRGTQEVLVELEEKVKDSKQDLKRLPAVKRRSDEHQFLAARRLITQFLRLNDNYVTIDTSDVRVVEEETQSVSYPGLATVYRKRFIRAILEEDVFLGELP